MSIRFGAILLSGLILLSGCSNNSGSYEGGYGAGGEFDAGAADETADSATSYTAENPGTGISGEPIPAYTYFGRFDLPEGDIGMYVACKFMRAYETGVVVEEGEDIKPEAKVLKEHFRTNVIFNLGLIAETYPEALIYQEGALQKLADPSQNPEGYVSLQNSCEPYLALLDRMDAIAAEEVALFPQACWANDNGVNQRLEVKLGGEWESLGNYMATEQKEICPEDSPYAATAQIQLYGQSWDFRWVYVPSEADSFSDGSEKIIRYFTSDQFGYISNQNEVRK